MKAPKIIKAVVHASVAVTIALTVFPIAFMANHVYYVHKNYEARKKEAAAPKKEFLRG